MVEIFVFLAATCLIVPLTSLFRLGSVLGYLAAGVIVGPAGFGFINDVERVMHFSEFGVIMMLFLIGLELEPKMLWRLRQSILGLGGLQVVLTTIAFTTLGVALGFSFKLSFCTSMALSLSSTALVLQMLEEKNLTRSTVGEISFSILLFQDIAVIPILIIMPLLANSHAKQLANQNNISLIAHLPAFARVGIVAIAIAAVIFAGRYLSHHLFRAIAKTKLREIFTALSLALVLGITMLMLLLGISPALGAFIAGVVLANSEYRRTMETDIEPFKGLLLGLFFLSIGMGIDFQLLTHSYFAIGLSVFALIAIKALILLLLGRLFGLMSIHNVGCALALSQGGEFAFVLFQFSQGLSILTPEQLKFMTLVVTISIAITPLIMFWYHYSIVPKFMSTLPKRDYDTVTEQNPIIIAGFGRFGQVIGRFLHSQGFAITVLENDPDQIDLLRKFGFKGYFADATRLDMLHHIGAAKAKLLIVALDDVNTSLDIVKLFKEEFPAITIFARARNRKHAYDLHRLGVTHFKRETFDSSLNMAKDIAIWLGLNPEDIASKTERFREHDEKSLVESFKFYDDEKLLINFARTSRDELSQIMSGEK